MAYTFIEESDLLEQIKAEFLANYKAGLSTTELDRMEEAALTTVLDKLRNLFDVDAIRADKPAKVRRWVATILLYRLAKRNNSRSVPEDISTDYDATIQWLNDIRDRKEHPDLPPLPPIDGTDQLGADDLRWNSRPPRFNDTFF